METDYEKIGLKIGLEVHQQLDTAAKLFCDCKPELSKEEPEITFPRKLRPTQSELGQIDPASYFEFKKGVEILYEATTKTSCLVEMDEEPPHTLNSESVKTALTVALMMEAEPVDEIHVMRKTVIDGSNTTGFQRTCIIALDGKLRVGEKTVPIQHISLEEDAARKMGEEGILLHYRIDRLGIPLIEVTTAPTMRSPKEAGEVALAIGTVLRATGKVKRGLGTIRQDLNISISNGALIEIKGVQELELVSLAVEYEAQRQLNLARIREDLKKNGISEEDIKEEFFDMTEVFKETKCKVIRKALDKNQQVLALKLPKFSGFLKQELLPDFRLGTEMADRARFWGRVGGIFHTDEMPAYGITTEEVTRLREAVKAEECDAVVFVADQADNNADALRAVAERARQALEGVPEETRAANPDGTSRYMRPRPGAARMYPETDIPPLQMTEDLLREVAADLPELPERKLERIMNEYKLNQKLAMQVLDSDNGELFETIIKESKASPTMVAVFLTETLKALKREGVQVEKVTKDQTREIFRKVGSGELMKESIPDIVTWLSKSEDKDVQEAINRLNLKAVSSNELESLIEKIITENRSMIRERGESSYGALMGIAMRALRGRTDATQVSRILKEKLEDIQK